MNPKPGPDGSISDQELTALALAADPGAVLPDGAVPFSLANASSPGDAQLLPDWYMPAPAPGVSARRGWRRRVAIGLVATFLLVNAAGLCSTYGWIEIA